MNYSPLRYPGGKTRLEPLIKSIIEGVNYPVNTYIEPFSGGAGVALSLLLTNAVDNIVINDYDSAIYSFWRAVLSDTNSLVDKIYSTPVNIEEWKYQNEIFTSAKAYSIEYAFATFYLNRTNRSGILSAGPIGGIDQQGHWKIDVRYNKETLINKILEISRHKKNIKLYNKDIRSFIRNYIKKYEQNGFVYFDPPYFNKGSRLYKNSLTNLDHRQIANTIIDNVTCEWIITYDDVTFIRKLYGDYTIKNFNIIYSAAKKRTATEIMVFKDYDLFSNIDKHILNGYIQNN